MKLLELFCGTKSISHVAAQMGWEVLTLDSDYKCNANITCDVLNFDLAQLDGFVPDVIWASPPCTTFSVASIGTHWTGGKGAYKPKTESAIIGLKILNRTIEIISSLLPDYWFIENPRGVMRKVITGLPDETVRHTISYCQYGDKRMKPTDIWTNSVLWKPKPICKNGSPCHESAPRGSKTGTQGLKGARERGIIPRELCQEILASCEVTK